MTWLNVVEINNLTVKVTEIQRILFHTWTKFDIWITKVAQTAEIVCKKCPEETMKGETMVRMLTQHEWFKDWQRAAFQSVSLHVYSVELICYLFLWMCGGWQLLTDPQQVLSGPTSEWPHFALFSRHVKVVSLQVLSYFLFSLRGALFPPENHKFCCNHLKSSLMRRAVSVLWQAFWINPVTCWTPTMLVVPAVIQEQSPLPSMHHYKWDSEHRSWAEKKILRLQMKICLICFSIIYSQPI